jgi:LysM repeat protein
MKNKNLIKHLIILAAIFTLLLGLFPAPASAAKPVACRSFYTVKSGDTLAKIAQKYNVRVVDLVAANHLYDPIWIYLQQSVCIPANTKKFDGSVPSYANRLPGDFTVTRMGNYIKIVTINFPKKSAYFVKMADATTPRLYQKVGVLNTLNKQSAIGKYKIPKNLRLVPIIQVCLKNTFTDANVCRNLINK